MVVDTAPPTPLIYARRLGLSVMRYGLGWFAHTRTQCFSPGRYRLTFPKIRKTTGIYIFVELPAWSTINYVGAFCAKVFKRNFVLWGDL